MRILMLVAVVLVGACDGRALPGAERGDVRVTARWELSYSTCPGGVPVKGPALEAFDVTYPIGLHLFADSKQEGKCTRALISRYDVTAEGVDAQLMESQDGCEPTCISRWDLVEL